MTVAERKTAIILSVTLCRKKLLQKLIERVENNTYDSLPGGFAFYDC